MNLFTISDYVQAFNLGDEKGFDFLFRQFFGPLSYYAYQQIHNENDAEDIVQDCFVDLWKRRKKLKDIEFIKAYLYRAVRNQCLLYLKKNKRRVVSAESEARATEPSIEQLIITTELLQQILLLINNLPPRMQQVLRMHFLEGKSCADISELLGTSIKTVEKQRFRAIQLIRKVIITT